jgi:hypothetical protein
MANTYEAIATVTVGSGGAAEMEFTSIPATYTDLLVKFCARSTQAATSSSARFELNGSTSSFTGKNLQGTGSAAQSGNLTSSYLGEISGANATATTFGNGELYIPNYASSNNKSFSIDGTMENNATLSYSNLIAGLWSNTAAITSITLYVDSTTFAQYSTATLYGIKNS